MSLLSMLALASIWSLTTFVDHARANGPGGGGGSPPANPAIAYSSFSSSGDYLRVMNADGTNATTIYTFPSGDYVNRVSWSPSGGSIAFIENFSVCRIDVSVVNGVPRGSNRTVLLARSGSGSSSNSYFYPAWSPLGDEIVFGHARLHTLMTIPAAGGTPQTIYTPPPGTLMVGYPAWSPDGEFIAFWESGTGVGGSIRILELATGLVTTVLGPPSVGVNEINWARTQDAIVFSGDYGSGGCR